MDLEGFDCNCFDELVQLQKKYPNDPLIFRKKASLMHSWEDRYAVPNSIELSHCLSVLFVSVSLDCKTRLSDREALW